MFFIGNKNKVISKSTLAEHLSGDIADMLDNHDFVYAHVKNFKRNYRTPEVNPISKRYTVRATNGKIKIVR
jgi:hypothetical protein